MGRPRFLLLPLCPALSSPSLCCSLLCSLSSALSLRWELQLWTGTAGCRQLHPPWQDSTEPLSRAGKAGQALHRRDWNSCLVQWIQGWAPEPGSKLSPENKHSSSQILFSGTLGGTGTAARPCTAPRCVVSISHLGSPSKHSAAHQQHCWPQSSKAGLITLSQHCKPERNLS